jgi:hypothetical protein
MPSADFCTGVREPHGPLSLAAETRCRPPEVSSTTFTAHPPDLQPQALDGYGLRGQLSARPTWAASYPISVRQVAALLHASFRPRLAATPLRFARTSPPSGCAGDLHPGLSNMLGTQLNRSAVGKTAISLVSRRPHQFTPSALSRLLHCIKALPGAILGPGHAWRRASVSSPDRSTLFPQRAPYPAIQSSDKAKAVPVAA